MVEAADAMTFAFIADTSLLKIAYFIFFNHWIGEKNVLSNEMFMKTVTEFNNFLWLFQ